jgi:hypothetical protein
MPQALRSVSTQISMRWLSLLAVVLAGAIACTCGGGGGGGGAGGGGTVAVEPGAPLDPRCAKARPTIEALYRAEAQAQPSADAARVDEAVRDNTAMVLAECARRPGVAACAGRAKSALEMEGDCLEPLDDEGTEGNRIRR